MSPDQEARQVSTAGTRPGARPRDDAGPPELETEHEVDFARYWWAIVARWWLVVGAVVLGAVIGYRVSLGGGAAYQARATVYLGQPQSPTGSNQITSLQTNPSTVSQIVKGTSVIRSVAARVGVPPEELRQGVSSRPVLGSTRQGQTTQLAEITVRGPWRRQSADAANLLATIVIDRVSKYADTKITQLTALLESLDSELRTVESSIEQYRTAIANGASLSPVEQLVLVGLADNAELRRGQLLEERTDTAISLSLAQEVERGQIVTRASPSKVAARSRRSSVAVGAAVGLVAGVGLALLWEPLVRRRRKRAHVQAG